MDEMSTHCFGSTKLHFHLFTLQSWYNSLSFLVPFFTSTHHWIWRCLKFSNWSSFTTSLSTLPIHTIQVWICGLHQNKIAKAWISKWSVNSCFQGGLHVFRITTWSNNWVFRIKIDNGRNGTSHMISPPIVRRPKTFQEGWILRGKRFNNNSRMFS